MREMFKSILIWMMRRRKKEINLVMNQLMKRMVQLMMEIMMLLMKIRPMRVRVNRKMKLTLIFDSSFLFRFNVNICVFIILYM